MSLSRYTIKKADFPAAIKFLAGKSFKKDSPSWAVRNKQFLQVVDGKVRYNNKGIVADEDIDAYLRGLVFNKESKSPLSRDGMFKHIQTLNVAGISRRRVAQFLKGQSVVVKGKPAEPVPKHSGKKLKRYHIETDLIFVRRKDVIRANKHFVNDVSLRNENAEGQEKDLTYLISTIEKITGLTRIHWIGSKLAEKVTEVVIRQMKSIAKSLKTPLKEFDLSSDKGGEFSQKRLEKLVHTYKRVPTGASVEKRNGDIQRVFFQMLRARRGKTIPSLVNLTEQITNNNYNRIIGKSANRAVKEEKKSEDLTNYNKKRQKAGKDLKKMEVGEFVRIRLLKTQKEKGLAYKSYKNMLWSDSVHKISAKSKRAPVKYRVNGKWYLSSMLMKSAPIDQKSEAIIAERDSKSKAKRKRAKVKNIAEIKKRNVEIIAKAKRPRRRAAARGRAKALKQKQAALALDDLIGSESD
jgi:hypothetical protein